MWLGIDVNWSRISHPLTNIRTYTSLLFAILLPCFALAQGQPGYRPEGQLVNFVDKTPDEKRGIRNGTYAQLIDFRIDNLFDLGLTCHPANKQLKTVALSNELGQPLKRFELDAYGKATPTRYSVLRVKLQ